MKKIFFVVLFFLLPPPLFAGDIVLQTSSDQQQYFTNLSTHQSFIPRGHNLTILGSQLEPWSQQTIPDGYILFDPGHYSSSEIDKILSSFSLFQYNTIRVFLSDNAIGNPQGGLSSAYLANVTDFLRLCQTHQIYVILSVNGLPKSGGYYATNPTNIQSFNAFYLLEDFVSAKKRYFTDLIAGLKNHQAPLSQIFAYQLENEVFFLTNTPPLSLSSGQVTTATGTFDMSLASSRQQMMDSNLVNWANQLTDHVKSLDPTALVTAGFYSPLAMDKYQLPSTINTYPIFHRSHLDFVDIHLYPNFGSLTDQLKTLGIEDSTKPIVAGEYGAAMDEVPSLTQAISHLIHWQVDSCQVGVRGWITWGYGRSAVNATGYYSVEEGGNLIHMGLSPKFRPHPCQLESSLPGDANADSKVDLLDFSIWKQEYLKRVNSKKADFNTDATVNLLDFAIWKKEYLK